MAYDRMDWHYGGDFPKDLRPENGGTHIGMFLAWCILNNFSGEIHDEESPGALEDVRQRRMTGRVFLQKCCDEKFWEEDLNEEGNRFAKAYYAGPGGTGYGAYIEDYESILTPGYAGTYYVQDSWLNYDKLAPRITQRYAAFKSTGSVQL